MPRDTRADVAPPLESLVDVEVNSLPEVVVAADVVYEPRTGRALAHRCLEALARGSQVLIGDSPGRAGRPAFLQELKELGVTNAAFQDVAGETVTGPRNDLICGINSTSVSPTTPQELIVAVMHLHPDDHVEAIAAYQKRRS